jgi:AraC family transcriptional regulator
MDVKTKKFPPIKVAYIRHIGPYEQTEAVWRRLMQWAGPKGLLGPGTLFLGYCHDNPESTPPAEIRYDACVSVEQDVEPEGEVCVQVIPEGEYAVAVHRGPYSGLCEVYKFLYHEWPGTSGRVLKQESPFEIYYNNPETTPEADLLTEVCVPLEPR